MFLFCELDKSINLLVTNEIKRIFKLDMTTSSAAFRRKNPLTGEWVLVSPHRNNRPWQGAQEFAPKQSSLPSHDANCPLCPGNERASGEKNPNYATTFVFTNDFAALTANTSESPINSDLFIQQSATGLARVICFSPCHNKTLPQLSFEQMTAVVAEWKHQYCQLMSQYTCIQIFENKGEMMGCSQPHPHGQIWAHNHLSTEIEKEQHAQLAYYNKHGRSLLQDYIAAEQSFAERIVAENDEWIVVVPYWAKWPFETLLVCKSNISAMHQLNQRQEQLLAKIMLVITIKYDNIFNCSFPYSMGWHNAPCNLTLTQHWRLHAHFYPPLLRSATIKKHMVGYEMLAEPQRDLTPECAAKILRDSSNIHYLKRNNE